MSTKRILVVDDEPSVTRNLKLNLASTAVTRCARKTSSPRLLARHATFIPGLILLDVH